MAGEFETRKNHAGGKFGRSRQDGDDLFRQLRGMKQAGVPEFRVEGAPYHAPPLDQPVCVLSLPGVYAVAQALLEAPIHQLQQTGVPGKRFGGRRFVQAIPEDAPAGKGRGGPFIRPGIGPEGIEPVVEGEDPGRFPALVAGREVFEAKRALDLVDEFFRLRQDGAPLPEESEQVILKFTVRHTSQPEMGPGFRRDDGLAHSVWIIGAPTMHSTSSHPKIN